MKKALIIASVPSMIEQFNMNNIKILQELGYQVDVATNFENGGTISKERTAEFKKELANINVKCYNIPFARNPFSKSNIKAYKEIKKIVQEDNNYNIIHMHSPIGGVCGRLACRKLPRTDLKIIYTAHGFHFYKGAPLLNWIIYYPIEKWLSKYTDCLITINKEDYELAKKKFKAKRVELVNGVGVDENKFNFEMSKDDKHQLRKSLGLKDDDFVLIQVGELNKNKNQIMAIETMKDLVKKYSNIHLLIVGIGGLEDFYKQKVKEYNLSKNIHLLGYRKDVPKLLKISDMLLSLSYREGLPVNVIEGLMAGLPAIVTDCRGSRDLVEDGVNGYVIKNQDMLINKIREIKDKNELKGKDITKLGEKNINKEMKKLYDNITNLRVIHILASNKYSGAENVAITIINRMKEKKVESIYVSPDGEIRKRLEQEAIAFEPIKKVSIGEIKAVCKKYNPDIIHAHDFTTSVISAFSNVKVKIISHLHNNPSWIKKLNIKTLSYLISSIKYSKIILVSDSILDEFIFSKFIKNKVVILGNPLETSKIKEKARNYSGNIEKNDVVFCGRLETQKDPLRFIEIISKIIDDYKINVAMIGDGTLREQCEQKIKEKNLSEFIKMYGFIENPYPIMANSKILCMTSKYEGFGLVAVEALTFGLPVVATNVGGLPKIVDSKCGMLCEDDKSFQEELYRLLNDVNYYNKKSENAIKKSKKLENISAYIDNLFNIYTDRKEK